MMNQDKIEEAAQMGQMAFGYVDWEAELPNTKERWRKLMGEICRLFEPKPLTFEEKRDLYWQQKAMSAKPKPKMTTEEADKIVQGAAGRRPDLPDGKTFVNEIRHGEPK